jgi:hypothetical protein
MTMKPRKRDPSYTTLDCTFSPWCIETISLHPSTELHRIEQPIISGRHTTTTSSALNPSIQKPVAPEAFLEICRGEGIPFPLFSTWTKCVHSMGSQITMDDVKHHLLDIAVLYLFIEKTDCFCSFFVGTKFAPGFPDWTLIIYFVAKFSEISGVIRGLVSEVISLVFLRKHFEV